MICIYICICICIHMHVNLHIHIHLCIHITSLSYDTALEKLKMIYRHTKRQQNLFNRHSNQNLVSTTCPTGHDNSFIQKLRIAHSFTLSALKTEHYCKSSS